MSLSRYAKTYLANHKKYANLNAFITLVSSNDVEAQTKKLGLVAEGSLDGKPIAIKDNICTKDLPTTAASGILQNFTSPYDATVVTQLKDGGAVVIGKTNLDEFGMGSHSTNSYTGPVKMRRYGDEEASAGGSSGGSALAVASSQCWAALGTDTGGSVRLPAAYTGTIGFKPSYGLISRWGVIAYANSLDTVGIFANNVKDIRTIFNKLNRHDPNDPTSVSPATRCQLGTANPDLKSLRIGIPLDYNISTLHPTVRNAWIRALKALSDRGHTLHPVQLPATQHALSAYYVLAPAEASSNLAKYDGVRFGTRADGIDGTPESVLFAKTRGSGFGPEVQRRILLGAFSLSAQAIDNYFIKAQKVRRLVQEDFNNAFAARNPLTQDASTPQAEGVDVILCPTAPTLAPALSEIKIQDPIHAYMNDVFTVPASLAGLPAISVPVPITKEENTAHHGDKGMQDSAGLQFIGQYGEDKVVLHAAAELIAALPPIKVDMAPDMTACGTTPVGAATLDEPKKHFASAMGRGITIAEAAGLAARARKVREPIKDQVQAIIDMDIARTTLELEGERFGLTRDQYVSLIANEQIATDEERQLFAQLCLRAERIRKAAQSSEDRRLKPPDPDSRRSQMKARRAMLVSERHSERGRSS